MWRRIIEYSDLILIAVLVALGLWVMHLQDQKLDAAAVATLAGALFGGGALLLGNWINRRDQRQRDQEGLEQRRASIKSLVAAELVNVAAGLIGVKDLVDAALASLKAGSLPTDHCDLSRHLPREMPFANNLGVELLTLEQPAIDALATLRCNLVVTRASMEAISEGRQRVGMLTITPLANGIAHDMKILADAFKHIAPDRQLALPGHAPELATVILYRMATMFGDQMSSSA